jgi:hypothetical protein
MGDENEPIKFNAKPGRPKKYGTSEEARLARLEAKRKWYAKTESKERTKQYNKKYYTATRKKGDTDDNNNKKSKSGSKTKSKKMTGGGKPSKDKKSRGSKGSKGTKNHKKHSSHGSHNVIKRVSIDAILNGL